MNIAIVILGCDKNTVDAEHLAGLLTERGHDVSLTQEPEPVDLAVIFSCTFIEEARDETLRSLRDWLRFRKQHAGEMKVAVIGCLPQVYRRQVARQFPEIDYLLGVGKLTGMVELLEKAPSRKRAEVTFERSFGEQEYYPRALLFDTPYAFLKISEGCDHRCSFCIIPRAKGRFRSIPPRLLLSEAERLLQSGIKELILVGQDTSSYGKELPGEYSLARLLKELCQLGGDFWIRLLYLFPSRVSEELMETIAGEEKICSYLDLPLQHFSPRVLQLMRRPYSARFTYQLVEKLRERIPGLVLRTAVILGHPGEGKREFQDLLNAVKELRFERLGCFVYSPMRRLPSLPLAPSPQLARRRYHRLMRMQRKITWEYHQSLVGEKRRVLVESKVPVAQLYLARSYGEAPEVDGYVFVSSDQRMRRGDFVDVRITGAEPYDLHSIPLTQSRKKGR